MATPAQAAAATVGAGSLAAAGAYGITQAVNGSTEENTDEPQEDTSLPTATTFASTEPFTGEPYEGKLITLIKTTNLTYLVKPENNDQWWSWAFENKFPKDKQGQSLDSLFANVNNAETLKTACESSYKQDKDKYKFEANDYLLDNISSFCTKGSEKQDISEPKVTLFTGNDAPSGYDNSLLTIKANRDKLVKRKAENTEQSNEYWWKWAFKNRINETSKSTSTDSFKTLTLGYKDEDETSNITALNNACNSAYKKLYADLKTTTIPNLINDIKRFCSIDPETAVFELPEPSTLALLKNNNSFTTDYTDTKTLAKKGSNSDNLLDPKSATNQDWWEWVFNKHYPKSTDTTEKAKLIVPFNAITQAYKTISGSSDSENVSLNQACQTSYKKVKENFTAAEGNKYSLLDLVKKFCSPTSKSSAIEAPTET